MKYLRLLLIVILVGTLVRQKLSLNYLHCYYSTIRGVRVVTLDALDYCPLTWEWEV